MLAGKTRSARMASHSGEGAGTGTNLSLGSLAGLAGFLVLDVAGGYQHHVLSAELLLELTHKTHLVLPEEVLEAVWHEDDNGSSALVDNNFLGARNVQILQVWAELLVVDL